MRRNENPGPAEIDVDAQIMARVREGDKTALELLFVKHHRRVRHHVSRIIGNPDDSEELAQETFLRVYRNSATYQPTARFTTWVLTIAGNLALNYRRDRARRRTEALEGDWHEELDQRRRQFRDPGLQADEHLLAEARRRAIRHAVDRLPDRQRAVLLLHKFEGLACEEIAESLGCTNQAVRSMLVRAYQTLRTELADLL